MDPIGYYTIIIYIYIDIPRSFIWISSQVKGRSFADLVTEARESWRQLLRKVEARDITKERVIFFIGKPEEKHRKIVVLWDLMVISWWSNGIYWWFHGFYPMFSISQNWKRSENHGKTIRKLLLKWSPPWHVRTCQDVYLDISWIYSDILSDI